MLIGRCCKCAEVRVVTLKGLTASTGVTEWEYGPGSLWAQHYGADRITGLKQDDAATLNTYVAFATPGYWIDTANYRISGALQVNGVANLTIVKLNSTDGTEVESAAIDGLFSSSEAGASSFRIFGVAASLSNPFGLSGGDYGLVMSLDPVVEWIDYTTNTANKEYKLHAHTLHGGNVYFRTKTSLETISVPYNATAAIVEAAFEATSDCVSATATGGPWPYTAISLDVQWSQATGDIGGLKFDSSYTAGGAGSCLYQWSAATSTWTLVSDSCNPGPPNEPVTSGTYDGELRAGTCTISFPPKPTGTRNTRAVAVVWRPSTGKIVGSVGHVFGLGSSSVPAKLISETAGTVPTVASLANSSARYFIAGASDSVLLFPNGGTNGRTVEAWTAGASWTRIWQRYANGEIWSGDYAWPGHDLAQSGKVAISVCRRTYNTATKSGTIADISAGTFSEFDESEVSTEALFDNYAASSVLKDASGSDRLAIFYERKFEKPNVAKSYITFNLGGSQVATSTKKLLLGSIYEFFGWDSDRIYANVFILNQDSTVRLWTNDRNTSPPPPTGAAYAGSISRTYRWRFYAETSERYNGGEFRFWFRGGSSGLADKRTAWLDWQCSSTDIVNAVLAVFPENTEGVVSNIRVNPFGATNVTDNSPAIGLIEANLDIFFQAHSTLGFIPSAYVQPGRLQIETRNLATYPTGGGIVAFSATDASVSWSRNFGTKASPATTYTNPTGGWLRGSRLFVFGPVVDNELP